MSVKNRIKIERAIKNYDGFKGTQTVGHVLELVGGEIVSELTGKQIALVMSAVDRAYHAGKASTGAEVMDNAIWINDLNKLYELSDIAKIQRNPVETRIENIPLDSSDRWSGGHGKWIDGKYYQLQNIRHSDGSPRNGYNSLRVYGDGELIADGVCREEEVIFDA